MDAINRRLELLATTPFIALPAVVAASTDPDYMSLTFIGGAGLLILGTMVAMWARRCGQLYTMSLQRVRDATGGTLESFASQVLTAANRDIRHNACLNAKKGRAAAVVACMTLAGIGLLTLWLAL